ncbi:E3 ubiquitin-protein ligase RNF19B-like isoform X2 [Mercenaria mercenaria]|uniref:E3 ubiquitin-protein ligase RNF19B-like isoform X2 n=1 Tax=Mercenaria mercenaria TaxID=6596 RepID=UPI00234E6936|nr:E3 ubiquitin-protein ligase RNF19B-like isoform X2 [Mercenaria mercenaria]
MKRHDSEVISTTSSTSKGSDRRKNRFSIRRIFYAGRSGLSRMSLNSTSSAQSDVGFSISDRDRTDGSALGATAAPSTTAATLSVPSLTHYGPGQTLVRRKSKDGSRECPLCLIEHPSDKFPEISTCYHRSCLNCLQMYLKIEITESRVNIACPECSEKFHPNDIKEIVGDMVLMSKYEDFMLRRVLVADPDARWCPAPDCGYAVIATECAGCPKIKCERPGCNTYFCYHCKQHWHPNKTCDTARAERAIMALRSGSITFSPESDSQNFIKPCPRCSAFIVKENDGSCNHMTCTVCGAEFCWLCMKEISDLHYLSPSGCTFWGKKPWSRKKKILWQLGTLVGAPVGITLLAGIAVPAMIIGIPVWVGRKIHSRFEHSSKHRHNLAIVGGVTASILVSPVVAGLAVGIGVPILLGYVYGVVPISLCRSGGCGVRTTNSGGVRFEFEENETGNSTYAGAVDSQSVGTGHQVPNPSIAPSIGEASVGMNNSIYSGSGNHIDRVGVNREDESDRDSASHRAIAGSSLNGSMCGSTYAAVIGMHTKLEVQAELEADVPTGKRASFSSGSANFSIGEKSLGEKSVMGDDASTRGLAGSIANYKFDSTSLTPSDVHVDLAKSSTSRADVDHLHTATEGGRSTPRDLDISSLSSRISHDDKKKTSSCPGSPHSSCGMMLEHEDGSRHHSARCRKCRRAAKLAEKNATEQMNVHFSDQVSLQSFQADDAVLDLPMGKHGIDSLSEMCNEDGFDSDEALDRCSKRRTSGRINSEPAVLLTEVENDHPGFIHVEPHIDKHVDCDSDSSDKQKSTMSLTPPLSDGSSNDVVVSLNSSVSSMSMKFCKYSNSEEKTLSKCRSEEIYKKKKCQIDDSVSEKSKSEELCNKEVDVLSGNMKRARRESCELAMKNGRISPTSKIVD